MVDDRRQGLEDERAAPMTSRELDDLVDEGVGVEGLEGLEVGKQLGGGESTAAALSGARTPEICPVPEAWKETSAG